MAFNSACNKWNSCAFIWTKYLGLLYGIVFLSHQIGSFFGAYLGGLFHDLYGSYDYAWYLAIALSVFAAIIHLPIKRTSCIKIKKLNKLKTISQLSSNPLLE